MHFTAGHRYAYLAIVPFLGIALPGKEAYGQVIGADDGSGTYVETAGDRIDISGGRISEDRSNLFHSFEQFDITAQQTANFTTTKNIQNVVGRVDSHQASTINGTLQVSGSDASLYLMNPSGILLGPDAQLNLSGGFTATAATGIGFEEEQFSASTTDYHNLNGEPTTFHFETMQPGAVVNLGELSVEEGKSLSLIGGTVVNTGELSAPGGTITVAAVEGENTVRISQAEQLLSLEVETSAIAPTDYGSITSTSIGEMLTGGDISNATTLITNPDGSVRLSIAEEAIVESGGVATVSGAISTMGESGGNINVLGSQVNLVDAALDASGTTGGGLIRVGGDYQGNGPVFNATRTTVDAASMLRVDAIERGDGGRAIAWANDTTRFHGQISGTGGTQGGDGGFAEVSGKTHLTFTGLVDLRAPQGSLGDLLLDPENIFITDSGIEQSIGNDDYIPSTVLENQNSNINLAATNNIVIEDLLDNELTLMEGGTAIFTADADGVGGGEFIMQDLADVIVGEHTRIFIAGAGITVGGIDTHTEKNISSVIIPVGDVTLTSSEGVSAEYIHTYGDVSTNAFRSWVGGNVTVTAANGDIDIARNILTYSRVQEPIPLIKTGQEAGPAGNITLRADNGSVRVSTAFPTTNSVLLASSEALENKSAQGGIIDLFAGNGEIAIAGNIAVWSAAGNKDGISDAGNSGTVTLFADSGITVGDILAYSRAEGGDNVGTGGDVSITSTGGDFSGGSVDASSSTAGNYAKSGGQVAVQAGSIQLDSINTSSSAFGIGASNAGAVNLIGERLLSVSGIAATSTDGINATIALTGDDIDLTGGPGSVEGSSLSLSSATATRDIAVGADGGPGVLSLSNADLNAISNSINTLSIGHANASGEGILTLDQSVVDSAGSRPDITLVNIGKLIGPTPATVGAETTFLLEGLGVGRIDGGGIEFSNTRSLEGGSGNDVFRPTLSFSSGDFDSLSGGGGFNTLSYDAFAGTPLSVDLGNLLVDNIQRVTAAATSGNTLIGKNADNLWTIDGSVGPNSGSVNEITFENFDTLVGGLEADEFSFIDGANISGSLSGGGGRNVLDYSLYGSPISIDLSGTVTGVAAGFSDIESVIGSSLLGDQLIATSDNDTVQLGSTGFIGGFSFTDIEILDGGGGNNTLIGENDDNIWTIDSAAGNTVDGIVFVNFDNLTGRGGEDTFRLIGNSGVAGGIDGGDGRDRLDYSSYSSILPIEVDLATQTATGISTTYSSIESVTGSANENDIIRGTNNSEIFQANGSGEGSIQNLFDFSTFDFSEIERLNGQGGNNTIQGLAGANNWVINGTNSGLLNGKAFESFSNIEGGVGTNVFAFEGVGAIAGILTGNTDIDELNYSSYSSAAVVNLGTMTTTGAASFSGIETVVGSTNNDTIVGRSIDDTFVIDGLHTGNVNGLLSFSGIEELDGGLGTDEIDYSGYTTNIEVDLESSTATDIEAFGNIERVIGGNSDRDTIKGRAGSDDFVITGEHTGVVNGNIAFSDIEIIEGNTGTDTLDYSTYTTDIEVELGAAFNGNNTATGIEAFSGIETVIGGAGNNDRIVGSVNDDAVRITGANAGNVNDDIDFSDIEQVAGGDGNDTLDYSASVSAVAIDLGNNNATNIEGFESFERFVGSAQTNDRIVGTSASETFSISSNNAGTVVGGSGGTVAFSEIEIIDGGMGVDQLDYSSYDTPISIDLANSQATSIGQFENIEGVIGGSGVDNVIGFADSDIFELTSRNSGNVNGVFGFTSIESLNGEGGDNTLSLSSLPVGEPGFWVIDGSDRGEVNNVGFENFNILLGSQDTDVFSLTSGGEITGSIDAGTGTNTLDYGGFGSAFEVDLAGETATQVASITGINNVTGGGNVQGTLRGRDGVDNVFELTGDRSTPSIVSFAGNLNNTFTFEDISHIEGGTGNNTLSLENLSPGTTENIWQITGINSGSVNRLSFVDISNLVGGAGNDDFQFIGLGQVDGFLQGGSGVNTLDYSSASSEITIDLSALSGSGVSGFDGINRVVGSRVGSDRLVGTANNDTFAITSKYTGVVNGNIEFADIETIEGSGGADTLDYSAYTTDVEIELGAGPNGSNTATDIEGFSGIETVIGGAGNNDRIIGSSADDTVAITNTYTGNLNGDINFSDIERVAGGDGRDTLDYSQYSRAISVDLAASQATDIERFENMEGVIGGSGNDELSGFTEGDLFELTGSNSGNVSGVFAFASIERLNGAAGDNTLSLAALPIGNDGLWNIDGIDSGEVNSLEFENFSTLMGSRSADVFNMMSGGEITGKIEAGTGNNTLNYSTYNSSIEVNFSTRNSNGVSSFDGINNVVGSRQQGDRLVGTADADTFEIGGDRTGTLNSTITFSDIETLNGGTGDNAFVLNGATAATNITIEGGNDLPNGQSNNRLRTDGNNTTWQLTGRNQGSLQQNSIDLVDFSEIQTLENTSATVSEQTVKFVQANAQITGGINSGSSNLRLAGDNIKIGENDGRGNYRNGLISGSGRLTIRPDDNSTSIVLGGVDPQGPALNITEGELAAIQDGFIDITIGGESHIGGISLGGNAAFRNAVSLRSQGDIDTSGGELLVSRGELAIVTEGEIVSNRLKSDTRGVTLSAGEGITAESITARGGAGITATSNRGAITVNGTLDTGGGSFGNDVLLSAETDVTVGDIVTSGGDRSGNVTITSNSGGISTEGITTSTGSDLSDEAGSVTLASLGSIEVEFIEAEGHSSNTTRPVVSIDTRDSVVISRTISTTGNRLATADGSGGIYIIYGEDGEPAPNFSLTQQGLITDSVSVRAGISSQNLNVRNISVVNRGIQPEIPTASFTFSVTALQFRAPDELIGSSPRDQNYFFERIETSIGSEFNQYLGLSNNGEAQQISTLYQAQSTLRNVEEITGTTPALIYVYFLPDASTADAVTPTSERVARPDDQLEVMLIVGDAEPIRHRQWGVTREQVEAVGRELRDQATRQFSMPKQYLPPAQQLYDWIIRPMEEALTGHQVESIGFVLDTGLRTVPLSTLHDGNQYLIEDYSIGLLPTFSLTDFALNGVNRAAFDTSEVLAMGASRFENQPDLPAVDAELKMITDENWANDTFLNEDFVVDTLQTQLQEKDYGVVHLATHAKFEAGDLENSYIQFWDEQLSLSEVGILELDEADVSLIILSACNTAIGDAASEYGFAGFAVDTGVPSAVASLWPVSDEGTLGFMSQFYGQLKGSSIRTEALRQAQLRLINGEVRIDDGIVYGPNDSTIAEIEALRESGRWDFSHPFYWSAFTMIGNPW